MQQVLVVGNFQFQLISSNEKQGGGGGGGGVSEWG